MQTAYHYDSSGLALSLFVYHSTLSFYSVLFKFVDKMQYTANGNLMRRLHVQFLLGACVTQAGKYDSFMIKTCIRDKIFIVSCGIKSSKNDIISMKI